MPFPREAERLAGTPDDDEHYVYASDPITLSQGVLERSCSPLLLVNGIQDSVFPLEDDCLLLQHTELLQQAEIVPQSRMLDDLSGAHSI